MSLNYGSSDRVRIASPRCFVHRDPELTSEATTAMVFGETARVLRQEDGFLEIETDRDGYIGWVSRNHTDHVKDSATHFVTVSSAPVFLKDDFKSTVVRMLPLTAEVTVKHHSDRWCILADGTAMSRAHIEPIGWTMSDAVTAAETYFLGCPYVWGGKSPCGTDCSGLVQTAHFLTGVLLPRDSGPQQDFLEPFQGVVPQRGMIAGFKGHIGLMMDETQLLHANAHTMTVAIEPLADVIDRVTASDGPDSYNGLFLAPTPGPLS